MYPFHKGLPSVSMNDYNEFKVGTLQTDLPIFFKQESTKDTKPMMNLHYGDVYLSTKEIMYRWLNSTDFSTNGEVWKKYTDLLKECKAACIDDEDCDGINGVMKYFDITDLIPELGPQLEADIYAYFNNTHYAHLIFKCYGYPQKNAFLLRRQDMKNVINKRSEQVDKKDVYDFKDPSILYSHYWPEAPLLKGIPSPKYFASLFESGGVTWNEGTIANIERGPVFHKNSTPDQAKTLITVKNITNAGKFTTLRELNTSFDDERTWKSWLNSYKENLAACKEQCMEGLDYLGNKVECDGVNGVLKFFEKYTTFDGYDLTLGDKQVTENLTKDFDDDLVVIWNSDWPHLLFKCYGYKQSEVDVKNLVRTDYRIESNETYNLFEGDQYLVASHYWNDTLTP